MGRFKARGCCEVVCQKIKLFNSLFLSVGLALLLPVEHIRRETKNEIRSLFLLSSIARLVGVKLNFRKYSLYFGSQASAKNASITVACRFFFFTVSLVRSTHDHRGREARAFFFFW